MKLTEPQIEAVFEWIDLNVNRKTAIRFVKDFYKPNDHNKKELGEIAYPDEPDTFHGIPNWELGIQKPNKQNEFKGKPIIANGFQELLRMKIRANEKATNLSLVDESERENLEKYKKITIIESYSYPGEKLQVNSIEDYGAKNGTIIAKCFNQGIGYVSAVIAHRNFNGTGNTYWATIVK